MKEPRQELNEGQAFPDARMPDASGVRAFYTFFLLFLFLAAGILTTGYLYFRAHEKQYSMRTEQELSAIKELKVSQIVNWREERVNDVRILSENQAIIRNISRFMENERDHKLKDETLELMSDLVKYYSYEWAMLFNAEGRLMLLAGEKPDHIENSVKGYIADAMKKKKVGFIDLHKGEVTGEIHFGISVPLFLEVNKESRFAGVLILRIDPFKFLYPLIQSWPTPSRTGETLLVRREGNKVVFLNELRHRRDTAFTLFSLRFPLSKRDLPATMAVLGTTGIIEGIDYRGVPVMASIGAIPDSPWFIVSKMDKEEIYAPMRERIWVVVIFVVLLLLGSALGIGLVWRQQRVMYYRKQYEAAKAYRILASRQEAILASVPDIIMEVDNNKVYTWANQAGKEFFGEEVIGKEAAYYFEGEQDTYNVVQPLFKGDEKIIHVESWQRRMDGQKRLLAWWCRVLKDESGNVVGALSSAQDITERKKAEESLRKSEAFINNILESVGEGFVVVDPEFKIISANRAYCEMQKTRLEDIIGKHCHEVSHHNDKPCFMEGEDCAPNHTFKTGESHFTIHTHYDKENNPSYIETRSYPMKDAEGKVFAVIEVLNNITEKRMLEGQLRHSQKMEAIGILAGGIAHDFNNMLNVIIGYASLMQMHLKQDDPKMEQVKEILKAGDRAAHLTKGLLTFSRKQVMEIRRINLNEIIESFKKMLERIIGEDIELKIVNSGQALTVKADIVQIEQVLLNLASNARDAMPKGGLLMIETMPINIDNAFIKMHGYGEPGMHALITISDTGEGIDDRTREKIFEPFFTTKELGRGTGLGLSIVYGIIKQHNGYINCYSETGKGTTFKIYLPLIAEEAEKIEMAEAELPEGGTETILIAEDDASVRGLIKQILEGVGYKVIEAVDGEDAVVKFKENKEKIHLLLFDMIMPKKNGKDAYEDIKGIRHDIKAVFTSGYAADIIGIEGGFEFISKPVSPNELLRKVREVLG